MTLDYPKADDPALARLKDVVHLAGGPLLHHTPTSTQQLAHRWLEWVRGLPGRDGMWGGWSASEIMQGLFRGDQIQFICGQRAMVFLQGCLLIGLRGRYIEIGRRTNPYSHFLVEIWSPRKGWHYFDPMPDSPYPPSKPGHSALWLHQKGHPHFYYFRVLDSHPPWDYIGEVNDRFDRYRTAIEWMDEGTVPWEDSEVDAEVEGIPHVRLTERKTSKEADLYHAPTLEG